MKRLLRLQDLKTLIHGIPILRMGPNMHRTILPSPPTKLRCIVRMKHVSQSLNHTENYYHSYFYKCMCRDTRGYFLASCQFTAPQEVSGPLDCPHHTL